MVGSTSSVQAFELFLATDSTNPFGPHTTSYTYTDGVRHGPAWSQYKNGELEERGTASMDQKCGEWLEDG